MGTQSQEEEACGSDQPEEEGEVCREARRLAYGDVRFERAQVSEVLDYLQSKGIDFRVAPNSNIRTACFFHGQEREAKDGTLYIKVDDEAEVPGLFFCHVCEERGSLNRLKRHFGDPVDGELAPMGRKILVFQAAAEYYNGLLPKDPDAAMYLMDERNLSPETISDLMLGAADGNLNDFLLGLEFSQEEIRSTGLVNSRGEDFFHPGTVTIPYYDQGSCVQIRGRILGATKNKYKTPPNQHAFLYNTDTMLDTDEVILCEGEFDAMLLHELGYNAIGVPGVKAFKDAFVKFFSEMKRVYICFDTDDPGVDGAEKLAALLGQKAKIINLPVPESGIKVDISDYLKSVGYDTAGFDLLLKKARSGSLVRVEEAFEAWLDREGNPDLRGLETGYAQLDSIIKPGLLPGQLAVFLARTGTGKTIQMVNFMHRMIAVKPDLKVLFLSLEQTANEWYERARRLQGFYNPELRPNVDLNESTIKFYTHNMMMTEKNRMSMDDVRAAIRQASEEFQADIDIIVVDYLGYWARAFSGEPYVRTSDAVMALKELGKEQEVVIFSPHQVNRGSTPGTKIKASDSRESGVVEETADFLFAIEKPETEMNAQTAAGTLSLEILKSRHGGVGSSIPMLFAPTSLAVVPRHDELYDDGFWRMAQNEVKWRAQGEYNFEIVLERHRTGNVSLLPVESDLEEF